jgi:uncharacterized phiE125 gp8 family phage protein
VGLKIITPVATEVVSLDEVKSHCRIIGSSEDTYLSGLIKRARGYVEQRTGAAIGEQTLQLLLDAFPVNELGRSAGIRLERPPLRTVTWVKYLDADGVEQTLDSSSYYVDEAQLRAWICPASSTTDWPETLDAVNAVRVEYVAGHTQASFDQEPAKQFLLMLVGALYENRELFVAGGGAEVELKFVHRLLDRLDVPRFG